MKRRIITIAMIAIMLVASTVSSFAASKIVITFADDTNWQTIQSTHSTKMYESLIKDYKIKPKGVVVATTDSEADKVSALNLVSKYKYPLLLVAKGKENIVIKAIKNNMKSTYNKKLNVYIVGGEKAVAKTFETKTKKISGVTVKRYAGKDRYDTNNKTLAVFNLKTTKGYTFKASGNMRNMKSHVATTLTKEEALKNTSYFKLTSGTYSKRAFNINTVSTKNTSTTNTKNAIVIPDSMGSSADDYFTWSCLAFSYAKCINTVKNGKNNTVIMFDKGTDNNYKEIKKKNINLIRITDIYHFTGSAGDRPLPFDKVRKEMKGELR